MTNKLNPKQKLFCKLYATSNEFFGNGVKSYIKAYNPNRSKPNWYKTAKTDASRLLTNANLCSYIGELLDSSGLNDAFVDKQILFLITQYSDYNSKIKAIQEYNKIKRRITETVELKSKVILLD